MTQKQVQITKDDQVGYCLESSVAAWERNGWTRTDDGSSEESLSEPVTDPETEVPVETIDREAQ